MRPVVCRCWCLKKTNYCTVLLYHVYLEQKRWSLLETSLVLEVHSLCEIVLQYIRKYGEIKTGE